MKVMSIAIKSHQQIMREFKEAFEAARKRRPFKGEKESVSFSSLEAVRNFLTEKRLEILRTVREKNPQSVYELAKLVGRNFPSVLKDVEILTKHGLLKLTRVKHSPRRAVHPSVSYDAINLWIGIAA